MDIKPSHVTVKKLPPTASGGSPFDGKDLWSSECVLCPDMIFALSAKPDPQLRGVAYHTLDKHMPRTWWTSMPLTNMIPFLIRVEILEENGDTIAYSYREVAMPF